jgi:hypothetical protein
MATNNCNIDLHECKKSKKLKREDINRIAESCGLNPKEYNSRDTLCEAIDRQNNPDKSVDTIPSVTKKCNKKTLDGCSKADLCAIAKEEGYTKYTSLSKDDLKDFIKRKRKEKMGDDDSDDSDDSDKSDAKQILEIKKIITKIFRSLTIKDFDTVTKKQLFSLIEKENSSYTKEQIKKLIPDINDFIVDEMEKIKAEKTKKDTDSDSDSDDEPIILKKPLSKKMLEPAVPAIQEAPPISTRTPALVPVRRQPPPISTKKEPPTISTRREPTVKRLSFPKGEDIDDTIKTIKKSYTPKPTIYSPPDTCNPEEDQFCDDDFFCDITTKPGKCVKKYDKLPKDFEKIIFNGKVVIGTRNAINNLRSIRQKMGKPEGEEYKQRYLLSDKYNVGNKIRVIYTGLVGVVKRINDSDEKVIVEFPDKTSKSFDESEITLLMDDDFIPDIDIIEEEEDDDDKPLIPKEEEEEDEDDEPLIPKEEEEEDEDDEPLIPEEEEEEEEDDEPLIVGDKINFADVDKFLSKIDSIPEDDLKDLNIANNQILKCLGLL